MHTDTRQSFKGYAPVTLTLDVTVEALSLCSLINWQAEHGADSEESIAVAKDYPEALIALAQSVTEGLQASLRTGDGAPAPKDPVRSTGGAKKKSQPAPTDTEQVTFIDFFAEV